jgi:hypothetical protein
VLKLRYVCRAFFKKEEAVLFPSIEDEDHLWLPPDDCVWAAPMDFASVICLDWYYQKAFPDVDLAHDGLEEFFTHTLQIPNCTWKELIKEIEYLLEFLQTPGRRGIDYIRKVYNAIADAVIREPHILEELRSVAFNCCVQRSMVTNCSVRYRGTDRSSRRAP